MHTENDAAARLRIQIADGVLKARENKKLTQEALAERVDVSISTVRRIEGGKPVSSKMLHRVCNYLHIDKKYNFSIIDDISDNGASGLLPNDPDTFSQEMIYGILNFVHYTPLMDVSEFNSLMSVIAPNNKYDSFVIKSLKRAYSGIANKEAMAFVDALLWDLSHPNERPKLTDVYSKEEYDRLYSEYLKMYRLFWTGASRFLPSVLNPSFDRANHKILKMYPEWV